MDYNVEQKGKQCQINETMIQDVLKMDPQIIRDGETTIKKDNTEYTIYNVDKKIVIRDLNNPENCIVFSIKKKRSSAQKKADQKYNAENAFKYKTVAFKLLKIEAEYIEEQIAKTKMSKVDFLRYAVKMLINED